MLSFAKLRHPWRWVGVLCLVGLLVALCGCRELAYYAQAIGGEHEILSHRKPIAKLIDDPQTPEDLKRQLVLVQKLRSFAGEQLKLPINSRYLKYVDLHRAYVVWNVQAAPQFSLRPRTWWYPLVGSLDYRGYFSEAGARDCAGRIQARG